MRHGRRLRLAIAPGPVTRVLGLTDLDRLLPVHTSVQDAGSGVDAKADVPAVRADCDRQLV
ncbi:hypothetical protein GCM10009665_48290 [Kitasatospora nipponensis]|uniref:STAS domain-containing protein n=1 Tax=Kitasatospora nipponensis TaxID=258049 RepID=A0ABP4H6D2_9ACTN